MGKQLFNMSTDIVIGDSLEAKFWHNRWLEGDTPKILAPNLFAITVRKK